IYGMVGGSLSNIPYILELMKRTRLPFAIHIADDWINRGYFGLFELFYRRKLHFAFAKVLQQASRVQVISDKMSKVYENRYGVESDVFYNPVDPSVWSICKKVPFSSRNEVKLAYTGTIERYHLDGIMILEKALAILKRKGVNAKLYIYGIIKDEFTLKKVHSLSNVSYLGIRSPNELALELVHYDIMFLPFSFDRRMCKSTKLSMPTKLSEYMLLPQPILMFTPPHQAVTELAKKNGIAYLVEKRSSKGLAHAVIDLIENPEKANAISNVASAYANEHLVSDVVCVNFYKSLLGML
ncbi:MAG: glycosyltransferase, partial [Candidatus Cloacimonetes bacterium]|nr:glycosyltransferase [Candidatus Cloacimonadota bacterium]